MNILTIQKEYYDRRWAQEKYINSLQASRCAAILGVGSRGLIFPGQVCLLDLVLRFGMSVCDLRATGTDLRC